MVAVIVSHPFMVVISCWLLLNVVIAALLYRANTRKKGADRVHVF